MLKKNIMTLLLSTAVFTVFANSKNPNPTQIEAGNVIPNIIIKAGSRTPEENLRHQIYCMEQGGIDVTDKKTIKVTSGVLDSIMCEFPNDKKASNTMVREVGLHANANQNLMNSTPSSLYYLNNLKGRIELYVAVGRVSYPSQFYVPSVVKYIDLPAGNTYSEAGIEANNCVQSVSQQMAPGTLVHTFNILCRTLVRGAVKSHAKGCWNSQCYISNGTVMQE